MILVKDVTADLDRRLYHQECALSQENLAVFGAESLHQLSATSTIKCGPDRLQTWAAAAPCCAVQLAPSSCARQPRLEWLRTASAFSGALPCAHLGNIGAITGSVWVRGLRGNGLGPVECERVVHETIVAATVLLRAIIQLLLREVYQTLVSQTLDDVM